MNSEEIFVRISTRDIDKIFNLMEEKKIPFRYEKNILNKYFDGKAISDLSSNQANKLIEYLEAK